MILQELEFGSEQYRSACRLREAVLRRPLGLPLSEADLRDEGNQLHFAMFADQELVACVTAVPISTNEAKIRQTAVAPAYQQRGVASDMMRQVEAILAARGYTSLSLHARKSAIGFYRKLGYATVGEEFIEVTVPHQKMIKKLT
ncbi:MAG: GNAT family N-acetyltransferase [Betaproteobacteria bacterium]|nr:MAG: GNAT family N-acetyltransferase [Betaproteobacteria bacterium]